MWSSAVARFAYSSLRTCACTARVLPRASVSRDHLSVVATSASRADALAKVREIGADVVVVDMATRESLELIGDLRRDAASTKILAFAVEEVTSDILDCAEAGAAGYVTADASIDELVDGDRADFPRGARLLATCRGHAVPARVGELESVDCQTQSRTLTSRERQVLRLMQQGHSNKEIAQHLNIAEPTVKNHVHHLLEKLEVTHSRAGGRACHAAR